MIFFYSGTGNTKKFAHIVAERIRDKPIDIEKAIREKSYLYELEQGERLGFAIPVYFGGVPDIVRDFLSKLKIKTADQYYAYLLMTDGVTALNTAKQFTYLTLKQGLTVNGIFELPTYDTFDIVWRSAPSDLDGLRHAVELRTALIAEQVADRTIGNHYKKAPFPGISGAMMRLVYNAIKTSRFKVGKGCSGCGLCARNCPTQTIVMENNRPSWVKANCMLCLRCLHHCPEEAIDIFNTQGKPRYKEPI